MKKKFVVTIIAMGLLVSLGTATAFADSSYSYTAGQQRSQQRNDAYEEAATLDSEEEQEEFLNEQGIGDTEWSEEAAASFSYVKGKERGSSYRTDDTDDNSNSDMSSYSYVAGQKRGSSYHK